MILDLISVEEADQALDDVADRAGDALLAVENMAVTEWRTHQILELESLAQEAFMIGERLQRAANRERLKIAGKGAPP